VRLLASHEGLPATERSEALYARALGLIPAATQTLAKGPGQLEKLRRVQTRLAETA
jgi:hypothetical protein